MDSQSPVSSRSQSRGSGRGATAALALSLALVSCCLSLSCAGHIGALSKPYPAQTRGFEPLDAVRAAQAWRGRKGNELASKLQWKLSNEKGKFVLSSSGLAMCPVVHANVNEFRRRQSRTMKPAWHLMLIPVAALGAYAATQYSDAQEYGVPRESLASNPYAVDEKSREDYMNQTHMVSGVAGTALLVWALNMFRGNWDTELATGPAPSQYRHSTAPCRANQLMDIDIGAVKVSWTMPGKRGASPYAVIAKLPARRLKSKAPRALAFEIDIQNLTEVNIHSHKAFRGQRTPIDELAKLALAAFADAQPSLHAKVTVASRAGGSGDKPSVFESSTVSLASAAPFKGLLAKRAVTQLLREAGTSGAAFDGDASVALSGSTLTLRAKAVCRIGERHVLESLLTMVPDEVFVCGPSRSWLCAKACAYPPKPMQASLRFVEAAGPVLAAFPLTADQATKTGPGVFEMSAVAATDVWRFKESVHGIDAVMNGAQLEWTMGPKFSAGDHRKRLVVDDPKHPQPIILRTSVMWPSDDVARQALAHAHTILTNQVVSDTIGDPSDYADEDSKTRDVVKERLDRNDALIATRLGLTKLHCLGKKKTSKVCKDLAGLLPRLNREVSQAIAAAKREAASAAAEARREAASAAAEARREAASASRGSSSRGGTPCDYTGPRCQRCLDSCNALANLCVRQTLNFRGCGTAADNCRSACGI